MQTVTNYLIGNMAVSDILTTVVAVPRQITQILLGPQRWLFGGMFGSFLCKSVSFFQDISTAVSIFSILAIAIDRYRGIVFPFREKITKPTKICKIIIPLIWIGSMGLHVVYFYIFHMETYDKKTYCIINWGPELDARKSVEIYYIILLTCEIAIPLCLVTWLYSAIVMNLMRSGVSRCKGPSSCRTLRRLREDRKVVKNITAIVIAFVVSSVPINVFGILFYFVWGWKMPCGIENAVFAAHFIFYSNASMNPCIYFALNDKYRQGLLNMLNMLHFVRKSAKIYSKESERETLDRRRRSSTYV